MTHPTNPDGEVTVTDEKWDAERLDAAIQDFATVVIMAQKPEHGGMRKELKQTRERIHEIARLLSATQPAAVDRGATPVAWLIDPGAGSAVDRFQQVEPYGWQYDEVEKRGGSITPLYAAPLDKDASKPAAPFAGYASWAHTKAQTWWSNATPTQAAMSAWEAAAALHPDTVTRLKLLLRKLGLEDAVPDELARDSEGLFVIFGMMRPKIDALIAASPAAPSVEQDERGAYPVVLTNDELNALTKERFGNMHAMYAEGFRRLMRTAIEANSKKARAVSTSANVAQDAEAVVLQHVAVAEDGGKLRWMTGRRPRDCELYAMPDGGRIPPKLYGAPPEQTALTDDARGAVLTEIRHAISDYHFALDLRAHGGIAQDHAFNTICKSLGMHWKQGEETARRALTAAQSASGG